MDSHELRRQWVHVGDMRDGRRVLMRIITEVERRKSWFIQVQLIRFVNSFELCFRLVFSICCIATTQ